MPARRTRRVAAKARAHLDHLADLYATPAREAELIAIFKEATRLEADFREMGRRVGQAGRIAVSAIGGCATELPPRPSQPPAISAEAATARTQLP